MERIDLNQTRITFLMDIFDVHKGFILRALNLTHLPELKCESQSLSVRDARTNYYKAEEDSDEQRSEVRKMIDLSISEEDVLSAFQLATSELEKYYAVRKMTEIYLFEEV